MPAQQRRRLDEKRALARSRQSLGERRQHGAIGCLNAWAGDLPLEHLQLMPKEEDLDLLGPLGTAQKNEQLEQTADRPVDERQALKQQTLSSHPPTDGLMRLRRAPEFVGPTGRASGVTAAEDARSRSLVAHHEQRDAAAVAGAVDRDHPDSVRMARLRDPKQ
jgi:hypothetical protein